MMMNHCKMCISYPLFMPLLGRHVTGAAAMISDLLFADPTKSILFVGPPGSGKVGLFLLQQSELTI